MLNTKRAQVIQLPENGTMEGAATHRSPLRAPLELVPFTGKERDEETGYGYFGARYMDHELMTMWLSVDPMADKYPSISPYAYCAWNPVKLVDPDGEEIDDYFSKSGKYLGSDNAVTNKVRIISETDWNKLDKDENGRVAHEEGSKSSALFSQASSEMSDKAQLEVYNHYNPTNCELFVEKPKQPKLIGMQTHTFKGKTKIGVYLENNRKGMKICDYADEIINMFSHEERHVLDHKIKKYVFEYEYEQSAIKAQLSHESFNRTRPEFRHAVANYARSKAMMPNAVVDWWDPGK